VRRIEKEMREICTLRVCVAYVGNCWSIVMCKK